MRPSASIVIPAWNEWELTRACLETLRPTLGLRDEVIVVDNGSTDGTAAGLRRYGWVHVVSHAENLGFAAGCNSGTARATGEVVVFLNNDTLLPSRWLDGLLRPFSDSSIGAAGPRSNFVSGPQVVEEVPYDPSRTADLQRFARDWRAGNRGRTSDVRRLVGFCLAVRRSALESLGGFDESFGIGGAEDDDLCLRLLDEGHRLVIAHESFVHHHGHRTFEGNGVDWFALQQQNLDLLVRKHGGRPVTTTDVPLISACMIVKDEESALPDCLAALTGVADEIVVYDTGSSDRTVAIAEAAGATVLRGHWDDDFSRARNEALAHCSGEWILHVDADEIVHVTAEVLRQELRRRTGLDAFNVTIDNLDDEGGISTSHRALRLFRRGRARWSGRLHEQVVPTGVVPLQTAPSSLRIVHSGYTTSVMEAKSKQERNLRVASRAVEHGEDDHALLNLGRALGAAGRHEEALPHFELLRERVTAPAMRRQALRVGAETLIALGRSADALGWVSELREVTTSSTMPDFLEGVARLNLLDTDGALACFDRLQDVHDEELDVPEHMLAVRRGLALSAARRWDEAADALLGAATDRALPEIAWAPLVEALWQAGRDLEPLRPHLTDEATVTALGHAVNASTEAAEGVADLLWPSQGIDPRVVAFVGALARRLPVARALEWSARFRSAGLDDRCPLATIAGDDTGEPMERLKACAVMGASFDDPRAVDLIGTIGRRVPDQQLVDALLLLDALHPQLLPSFVARGARGSGRAAAMSAALTALGAHEQAEAVLELATT